MLAYFGKFSIVAAVFLAFISLVIYLLSQRNDRLKIFAKTAYISHFVMILLASAALYVAIFNHYFEFSYVWKHSATYLPNKYLISAFWSGQEGSFLLWVLFQGILGMILLFTAKRWESGVMAVMSAGQFLLTTMVLGAKPFGMILGQSPFTLLREQAENIGNALFQNPDYASQITEGNGINPLLENYWMVIHPPILFIGYAAAIVPFAFAITALFKKNIKEWLSPAFPWTVFAVLSLGTGILLGGAWAYESLTFGGFWAWDPVENASLIPWLVLLGAMHMMILNKRRSNFFGMSFILIIAGYFFVIYASYLTRSGVLGATSVHAFGNNGLSAQMVVMMLISIIVSLFAYLRAVKSFPNTNFDDFLSREFWMFLGTLVLMLSAFQIFITTSVPVFNKIFGLEIAPPLDVVGFYNKWQLPFGIAIVFSIAVSLVMKYGKNNLQFLSKAFLIKAIVSIFLFIAEIFLFKVQNTGLLLFLFFASLSFVSSVFYLFQNRKNIHNLSNTFSHLGFSLMMIGIIVAFSTSSIISKNTSSVDFGENLSNNENQLLVKGENKQMGDFSAVYSQKKQEGSRMLYSIDFFTKSKDGKTEKAFTVEPSVNANMMMGNVYDPDTKHELKQDVFTYITYADLMSDFMGKDTKELVSKEVSLKDTLFNGKIIAVLDTILLKSDAANPSVENLTITAVLNILKRNGEFKNIEVSYIVKNGQLSKKDCLLEEENLIFSFVNLSKKPMTIELSVSEKQSEFIVVKSIIFPWISLLWLGAGIMILGLILSLWKNIKSSKRIVLNDSDTDGVE